MKSQFILAATALSLTFSSCNGDSNPEKVEAVNPNHATKEVSKKDEVTPASQRVDLENKGIGPVKEVVLAETIDDKMVKEGAELFENNCTACHKVDRRFIGPALKGILDRRTPEWTMNMIMNPDVMVEKDPLAKDLYIEYSGSQMTNQGINKEEARAILEYIRSL
ncbi:c-type cytochrome [Brumimicrobium aurantiacum]|uniref:Cytochrome c n=1 Tax=Brumimicrobium aurantiacum TaxID=1737063 RepID=A0A3E1EYA5_9FLAO|nr:cytochrome c [Brumimicrobium aurantiacum]RFC54541.1 cytochrome c [Brumimicrobium aurantiacum]